MSYDAAQGPVAKNLSFGPGGLRQIASGVHLLAGAMRRCYGPKRSRTMMARLFDSPVLVSGAWQIAKGFDCDARVPNIGVRLLQEALDTVQGPGYRPILEYPLSARERASIRGCRP